jgi:hypothetical protein
LATGLSLTLSEPFSTIMPNIVGLGSDFRASAQSQAQLTPVAFPATLANPIPIGVPLAAFQAGAAFDLYDQQVASASYGVAGYQPFLDLTTVTGGSGSQAGATSGDLHTDIQYWADGAHNSGTLAIGSTITLAGAGYATDLQTGLLDNVTRQGLVDGSGRPYALVSVPLWDTYTAGPPAQVNVVGFALFKILRSDVGTASLPGYFVPYVPDPASKARISNGFLWSPAVVALTR